MSYAVFHHKCPLLPQHRRRFSLSGIVTKKNLFSAAIVKKKSHVHEKRDDK